jgi:hypothetical protein
LLLLLESGNRLTFNHFVDRALQNSYDPTNFHEIEVLPSEAPITDSGDTDPELLRSLFDSYEFGHLGGSISTANC